MIGKVFGTLILASTAFTQIAEAAPKVVVSIKPVHSIVSSLTKGVATPELLIDGIQSPHTATLKPVQAKVLQNADVVVWVGPELEQFLKKPLTTVSSKATIVELSPLLEKKEDGHDHDAKHSEDKHDKEDDHDKHEDHDDHASHADIHIWLDPETMIELVSPIAGQLSKADPDNAETYKANAAQLTKELTALNKGLATKLAGIKSKPFLTYHDAYGPFVEHYGLNNPASVAVDDHRKPSAAHLKKLQAMTKKQDISCLFTEPQFKDDWLKSIWPDATMKYAVLDPLGSSIEAGPAQYGKLMNDLADNLVGCLGTK